MKNDLFNSIEIGARFSGDRKYRYLLWRIWDKDRPLVMFIGLNPSTANEDTNNPTIQSVMRIASHNDYGGVYMANCWPYISTDPDGLVIEDFTSKANNDMLLYAAKECKAVVFAWGAFKIVKQR